MVDIKGNSMLAKNKHQKKNYEKIKITKSQKENEGRRSNRNYQGNAEVAQR